MTVGSVLGKQNKEVETHSFIEGKDWLKNIIKYLDTWSLWDPFDMRICATIPKTNRLD